jgi:hypothetical protein
MEKKISPLPWKVFDADRPGIDDDNDETIVLWGERGEPAGIRGKENASAIVTAINSTYGKGIDPSSVPDLLEALKGMVELMPNIWPQGALVVTGSKQYIAAKAAIDKAIIK